MGGGRGRSWGGGRVGELLVAVLGELGLDLHRLVGIAGEEPAVGHFDGDDADRICEKEDGCSFPIWSEFR